MTQAATASAPTNRAAALSVACTGSFVAALSTSLVSVSAPVIAHDLHASQADVGWVLSAYLLTVSSLLAASGRITDMHSKRNVCTAGFIVFASAGAACSIAPTLPLLIAARVLQATGATLLMASGPAIVTRAFPASQRARGLGIQLAATYFGLSLGPGLGGILASRIGWHAVFVAIAIAGAIGAVTSWTLLRGEEPPQTRRAHTGASSYDVGGALSFGAMMVGLLLAVRGVATIPLLVGSAVAAWSFVRIETKHAAPLLPPSLLARPAFAFGLLGAMLHYAIIFILAWLVPFHLQHDRGMHADAAGALMTAQPVMMAIVAPTSGWLSDRFGTRPVAIAGMLLSATGASLVGKMVAGTPAAMSAALAVVGIGAGMFVAPNSTIVMSSVPPDRLGTAAAMAATARNVGMTCGVAIAVVLKDSVGFEKATWVAVAMGVAGALFAAVRPTTKASA